MRMIKRLAIAVASLAAIAIAPARGDVLAYTESFVASGSLGAQGFTDSAVTLTVFGDTSTLFTVPGVLSLVSADAATATVSIAGLPTATFTDVLSVFAVYSPSFGGIFGITDENSPNAQGDILDVQAAAFLTYNLMTPIGPISSLFADPAVFTPGNPSTLNNPNATDAGDLIFTSVGNPVTVQVTAVPEPTSLALCGLGLAGAIGYRTCRPKVVMP